MNRKCLVVAFLIVPPFFGMSSFAQTGSDPQSELQRPHMRFEDYLDEVLLSNLDLLAQRANIAISHAAVTSASVSPDWSADFGLPVLDLSGQGNPTTYSIGLDAPIELGGKRGHRIRT